MTANKEKKSYKEILNTFEIYCSTICFFVLTILLTIQVSSRYILGHSFTWSEEAAILIFLWMIYFGVAGAVTKRKHLRIDFLLDLVPFKAKRGMLIFSNVIFMAFNLYVFIIILDVIKLLGSSVTTMLRVPKQLVYIIIPFSMVLSIIRLIQDTIALTKENEKSLGTSKPAFDLDACERQWQAKQAAKKKEADEW